MSLQELGEEIQEHLHVEGAHQYKLLLPPDLMRRVQQEAQKRGMTMADLIRYYIRLGLELTAQLEPGARLIIQQEGRQDRQLIIPL
jgi:Ribbon-helix-helix protein, copG family